MLADLRGTVLGVPFRQVRAGVASGATSWNIPAGQLNLSFDDDGVSPSLDSSSSELYMQRRAGAIFIDFPLIQLRSLDPIGIDLTLASRESPMHSPLIAESAVDVAGAAGLLIFEEVAGLVLGVARPEQTVLPLPLSVLVSVAAVESPGEVNAVHLKA